MDKYYLEDHVYLMVNDDKNGPKEDGTKTCDFTCSFDKTIQLSRSMECALVKLHCPRKMLVYEWPEEAFIELKVKYIIDLPDWNGRPNAFLTLKDNPRPVGDEFTFRYDINLSSFTKQELINQLIEITNQMNDEMAFVWKMRYKNLLPRDLRKGQIPYPTIIHRKIKIIQNGKFQPEDGRIKVVDFPSRIKDKIYQEIALIAYFNFSEKLHQYLNLGVDYPLSEYIPGGFAPGLNNRDESLDKIYVRVKSIASNDIKIKETDVNLVYVYCDIIMESLINEQKANILQTFVLDTNSSEDGMQTIESRELQFISLRVDYISSITIQLCDSERRVLNYKKGRLCCVLKLRPIEII